MHPSGGQAAAHLAPQQRREVETDQIVQGAAGLLGVDQVVGQIPGVGHGVLYGAFGDFMEHHPFDRLVFERLAFAQQLAQVPGNGFAFAVRVGREEQGVGLAQHLGDGGDMFFLVLADLVFHGEVAFGIDGAFLGD